MEKWLEWLSGWWGKALYNTGMTASLKRDYITIIDQDIIKIVDDRCVDG